MLVDFIKKVAAAAVLLVAWGSASANPLFFFVTDTGPGVYSPGDTVNLDISFDFIVEPTLGGGFDLFWDAGALSFSSWTPSGISDPAFYRDPDIGPGEAVGGGFGDFAGLAAGFVGTLSLVVDAAAPAGLYDILSAENMDGIPGPFVSNVTFAPYLPGQITFGLDTIEIIRSQPVPAPGTALLLMAGLVGATFRRRLR